MKNLGDKFKKIEFKKFLIYHGEKIGVICVAALLLMCLMKTDWAPDPRTPKELATLAEQADKKIEQSVWPKEKKEEVPLVNFLAQAKEMLAHMDFSPYELTIPFSEPLEQPIRLATAAKWEPPIQPIASPGAVLLAYRPEEELLLEEELAATENADDPANALDLAKRRRDDILRERSARSNRPGGRRDDDDDDGGGRFGGGAVGRQPGGRYGTRVGGSRGRDRDERDERRGIRATIGRDYGQADDKPLLRAHGHRYAAVRAVFDLRQQIINVGKALRYSIPTLAKDQVVLEGFRIQRQRAVPGPNPWREENWEELNIDEVKDVLAQVQNFEREIMDPRVTDPAITMPLPQRVIGYWSRHATHPLLEQFELSEQERAQVEEYSKLLKEEFEKSEQEERDRRGGGFKDLTYHINDLRGKEYEEQQKKLKAKSKEASEKDVTDRVKEIFGLDTPKPSAPRTAPRRSGGRGFSRGGGDDDDEGGRFSGRANRGARLARNRMNRGRNPGRRGIPETGFDEESMRGIDAAVGRMLLFRYLDFTVKSGEAYRYRIKLIFENPAVANKLKRDMVDDEAVLEGDTRETEWSEPSGVVVIPSDTNAFITEVIDNQSPGKNGAQFEVFQWDRDLGTVIYDTRMRCNFGEFLGGEENTEVLNPAKPSFKFERAKFTSDVVLVDSTPQPMIDLADHPDLKAALQSVDNIRGQGETQIGVPTRCCCSNRRTGLAAGFTL